MDSLRREEGQSVSRFSIPSRFHFKSSVRRYLSRSNVLIVASSHPRTNCDPRSCGKRSASNYGGIKTRVCKMHSHNGARTSRTLQSSRGNYSVAMWKDYTRLVENINVRMRFLTIAIITWSRSKRRTARSLPHAFGGDRGRASSGKWTR